MILIGEDRGGIYGLLFFFFNAYFCHMIKLDKSYLNSLILPRKNDTHKRNYGHLLLVCGCKNMPGAALLATGASLKSGCGLVTLHSVKTATDAAVISHPSAMFSIDPESDVVSSVPSDLTKFSCIGVGPGLGRDPRTAVALEFLMGQAKQEGIPMLLDADALYFVAFNPILMGLIPEGSVMTPHEGELRRFISWETPEEKYQKTLELSRALNCTIVSKGYHSLVFTPGGEVYENTTGNPGLAKGGSGDVLTGLVAGLMARGYEGQTAAKLGTWVHGYAGDFLTDSFTAESYSSKDIIDYLWAGFKELGA